MGRRGRGFIRYGGGGQAEVEDLCLTKVGLLLETKANGMKTKSVVS